MNFHVLTLFPDMVLNGVNTSITGRAVESGKISVNAVDIRAFSADKHRKVDDYPYGGGAGMLMQAQPVSNSSFCMYCVAQILQRTTKQEGFHV